MSDKDRKALENIIKDWAQGHTSAFVISDNAEGNQGLFNTSGYLTWLVQHEHASLDLLSLVERLESYFNYKKKRNSIDGMFCCKCQNFFQFAEPNQKDNSLICYSCRKPNG